MPAQVDHAEFPAAAIGTPGPGRSRVAIAVLVFVGLLGAVVVKPWEASAGPAARTAAAATPVAQAAPLALATPGTLSAADALPWNLPRMPRAEVAAVVRPRPTWGLRAIVWDSRALEELWLAAPPPGDSPGEPDPERLVLDAGGRAVLLFGFTGSPGASLIGARAARQDASGRFERVPVQLVGLTALDEAVVLLAPRDGQAWKPGVYRLRAFLRSDQATLAVEIADPAAAP